MINAYHVFFICVYMMLICAFVLGFVLFVESLRLLFDSHLCAYVRSFMHVLLLCIGLCPYCDDDDASIMHMRMPNCMHMCIPMIMNIIMSTLTRMMMFRWDSYKG